MTNNKNLPQEDMSKMISKTNVLKVATCMDDSKSSHKQLISTPVTMSQLHKLK